MADLRECPRCHHRMTYAINGVHTCCDHPDCMTDDATRESYDFSKGERGKYYRQALAAEPTESLDETAIRADERKRTLLDMIAALNKLTSPAEVAREMLNESQAQH